MIKQSNEPVADIQKTAPSPFKVDNSSDKLYFNSKELQEFDPIFYYGCKTKPRNILVKKNIPSTEYLYANFNARNGAWMTSTEECKKAQLLITKSWVWANMLTMRQEMRNNISDITDTKKISNEPVAVINDNKKISNEPVAVINDNKTDLSDNIQNIIKKITNVVSDTVAVINDNKKISNEPVAVINDNKNISNEPVAVINDNKKISNETSLPTGGGGEERLTPAPKEYEMAPPLLALNENEKFRDADGNVLEIETRGYDRREDAVFFRCSDVSQMFDMPNLNKNITRPDRMDSGYEENTDYKYFNPHRSPNGGAIPNKSNEEGPLRIEKNPFALYLTYEGLLRVLFVSRNKHATPFRKWATAILFTHQMGTKDAKVKLGTDLLNITPKTYKAVFDSYASTFPCIYLLRLGTVKDVRSTFGIASAIPDDLSVYKYGFTEDLSRRIKEHASGYGKMNGVSIKLSAFHVIDPKYTSDAEGDVREFVETFQKRLHVEGHSELVSLTDKEMLFVKKQYASIGSRYAGATAELTTQIAELKARIKELENELAAKDLAHANEIQKELYEKKMVEMQRDTNIELFSLKEANYKLELQLLKQTAFSSGNSAR